MAADEKPLIKGVPIIVWNAKGEPRGIRDETGFLILFRSCNRYEGQEKRYEREKARMIRLADLIADALENA